MKSEKIEICGEGERALLCKTWGQEVGIGGGSQVGDNK